MSLCTEHVVSFIKWARESEEQSGWIAHTLLNNDYLRPEVRNGIVIVLIYTFAAIKAATATSSNSASNSANSSSSSTGGGGGGGEGGEDMFSTLQDVEQGLGIANKFSLKIYNDPFDYLYFLKATITGLIDAKALPDNERQNQPKKNKNYSSASSSSALSSSIASSALFEGENVINSDVIYRGKFITFLFICILNILS
jgi:hypothetical protein